MSKMYDIIQKLCKSKGITVGKMCNILGISRGVLSDLKNGRTDELSAKTTRLIADYFQVSVDHLYGREESPSVAQKSEPDIEKLKIALFGGDAEVTDEMWEEALLAAELIKERYKRKKGGT